ncbi:SDR family oxidoreductase [Nocardioides sp. NPDC101246]|uniref:SDR family oxidoreductase n=1 Tax=Nocardioides sp. NPDC101246 TaxID=3364336 RepID=UPI00382EBFE0
MSTIFITGASGWIGSAVTDELLANGYSVTGLARSDASAAALEAKGAEVHRGSLDDPETLAAAAKASDGVIHLAFKHDFTDYAGAGHTERATVEAMLDAIEGTQKPFLLASGLVGDVTGRAFTEDDANPNHGPDSMRGGSENLALGYAERGVRPVALRFAASVHGEGGDHGFVAVLSSIARQHGVSGYLGDGRNRWPAVHRTDAARMVRLALEKAPAGFRAHAATEEGIPTRDIAEAIGRRLGLPTASIDPAEAESHFGWLSTFFGFDAWASSEKTRETLAWTPTGPTLMDDIASGAYDA